jgi:aryl-alcohol dehydrogenase-like predicted oxidoreductase
MASVALAWSLAHPDVTAPIVGSTSLKHLEDLIAGVHLELTKEEFEHISEPYRAQAIVRPFSVSSSYLPILENYISLTKP